MRRRDTDVPAINVAAHPPERRRIRSIAPAQAGQCCCCCCCCCLHTIGSLIGAAVAPTIGGKRRRLNQEEQDYAEVRDFVDPKNEWAYLERRAPSRFFRAVPLFWLNTLIVIFAVCAYFAVVEFAQGNQANLGVQALILAVGIAVFLPVGQLVSAFITFIILAIARRSDEFGSLGRITLGVVLGTLAGILVMVVIGFVISAVAR